MLDIVLPIFGKDKLLSSFFISDRPLLQGELTEEHITAVAWIYPTQLVDLSSAPTPHGIQPDAIFFVRGPKIRCIFDVLLNTYCFCVFLSCWFLSCSHTSLCTAGSSQPANATQAFPFAVFLPSPSFGGLSHRPPQQITQPMTACTAIWLMSMD